MLRHGALFRILCIIGLASTMEPNDPTISGADAAVKEGDSVSVTCTVTRVKPVNLLVISWNVEGNGPITGVTSSKINADGKTFSVKNAARLTAYRQLDGKTLACHVMWNNTADFRKVIKTLNINYPPQSVSLTPGGATRVKHGTSVTMTCQIYNGRAKPLPTLSIFKEGITKPVKSQPNTAQMTHAMSVQREDNVKVFKCKATGGVISGSVDSLGISYYVLYPASIVAVAGVNGPVVEGTTVTLHCLAVDGNPSTYTYKWTHERNGQRSDLPESSSSLTLSDIQYTAAGRYKCQATNQYGPAEGFKDIIVHYSPKEDPHKTPIFKVESKTGDTKNLTMHVISLPVNVEFSWLHLGKKVEPDKVINDGLTSTLMLVNVLEGDFGKYTCIAKNTINQTGEFVFYLSGRQAPLAPKDINVVRQTAISLMVKWKRSFDGGFKQHFKIKYKKTGTSEVKETDKIEDPFPQSKYAETKVTPLVPATEYDLYVVAFSQFNGGSETQSGHVIVQTPARPQFNLDKFKVERKGTKARLAWVRPTGQYTHYVTEWCEKPGKTNCETENQGNETTSSTVSGLRDDLKYSFVLKVYDMDDLVGESLEFSSPGGTSDLLPVAVAVPLILIIIIVGAVVVAVLQRHRVCKGSNRQKKNAKIKGSSVGKQTSMSTIIVKTSGNEDSLGKTPGLGTSGTTEYVNVSFNPKEEVAAVNPSTSHLNQQCSEYENVKPRVHVYENVPNLRPEPTYINAQIGAQAKHKGEYEQLSSDAIRSHLTNEPNIYQQLERR